MEFKLLDEIIKRLDDLYPKYSKLRYELGKVEEEPEGTNYEMKIENSRQIYKIRKIEALPFSRIVKEENDTVTLDLYIKNDIDVENVFKKKAKEPDYDNKEELWNLRMILNKKITKDIDGEYYYVDGNINLSGDIVFNFNPNKCKYYEEIIKEDSTYSDDEKKFFKDMLDECASFHHSPQNTSIIIKTGGLNQFKQGLANDRFDVFIAEIERYYNDDKLKVLENGNSSNMSFKNRQCLEKAMDLLAKDKYQFTEVFYNLKETDKALIDRLIESGKLRIENCNGVYRYMCLAFEYWIISATYYCSTRESREKYLAMGENSLPPGFIFLEYQGYVDKIDNILKNTTHEKLKIKINRTDIEKNR